MAVNTRMRLTTVCEAIMADWLGGKRRSLHEGGTSSSKTYSALQALHLIAQNAKSPLLISIVSETLPHLKRGCIRDFFNIINESQDNNPRWSKTGFTYQYDRATIEFFGADNDARVRGPRRDILFINEGNSVQWEVARGLDLRTTRFTIVDWNPVSQFWAHEFWIGQPENIYHHSTYQDALSVLPDTVIKNIESMQDKDPNGWNVYGLGLMGKVENLVYPQPTDLSRQVDALPAGMKFYGLDFGYLVDPSVLVANVMIGDKLYSQQLMFEKGLTNDQIARKMDLLRILRSALILADPDEPKSIDEIALLGWNIKGSVKGPGSVEYSHQKVNQCYQYWTKDSLECIKEQRNFKYLKDAQGLLTDKTTHQWSHGMSARRYAVAGYTPSSSFVSKPTSYI